LIFYQDMVQLSCHCCFLNQHQPDCDPAKAIDPRCCTSTARCLSTLQPTELDLREREHVMAVIDVIDEDFARGNPEDPDLGEVCPEHMRAAEVVGPPVGNAPTHRRHPALQQVCVPSPTHLALLLTTLLRRVCCADRQLARRARIHCRSPRRLRPCKRSWNAAGSVALPQRNV